MSDLLMSPEFPSSLTLIPQNQVIAALVLTIFGLLGLFTVFAWIMEVIALPSPKPLSSISPPINPSSNDNGEQTETIRRSQRLAEKRQRKGDMNGGHARVVELRSPSQTVSVIKSTFPSSGSLRRKPITVKNVAAAVTKKVEKGARHEGSKVDSGGGGNSESSG